MAKKPLNKPWQAVISCEFCECTENVNWYCLNCDGNICDACKLTHLTDKPVFRKHRIVPRRTVSRQQSQPKKTCSLHETYIYTLYCYKCKVLVCTKCVTEKHNGHHLGQMADVMSKVRQEIADYSGKLKIETLAICQQELTKNKKSVTDNDQHFSNLRKIVTDKQQEMRKDVDHYCAKLLQHINDSEAKYSSSLSESKRKIEAKQREIRGIVQKAGAVLTSGGDADVVKFYREKPTSSELQLSNIPQYRAPPKPGTDAGKLDPLTQRMESIDMIAALGTDEAVIGSYIKNEVKFTDITGEKTQIVPIEGCVVDIAVMENTGILLLVYASEVSMELFVLSRDGYISRIFEHLDANPVHTLCITAKQEIVLYGSSTIDIYSSGGKRLIQSFDTSKMGVTDHNAYMKENGNTDLCVLVTGNMLYVLNRAGDIKFTYDGSGADRKMHKFNPNDVCCDGHCNILIADKDNHTVDMLDSDGHFLGYLLTWRHQITQPTALCIDTEGQLWVGQYDGTLSIIKYTL